ncbi:uncharacterized protein si:ch211-248a14.8 isoform X2 [Periophthalmus magnuspinnatus]|uniref:uncharacterized protein si:ch211-248a14.8 isoform X2 n=1 Tax=Periophthalmus magnuspinnatus TaxID=409849 RepID=UPI002436C38C|nr:uncharacterized protein si:ch211-248a14.8 isoform X2 [Periophthalmus magnuspinnatus]
MPTLCLLLFVIYSLGDKLHNFVAGVFIPQYHYPYAVALCFGKVMISVLFLNLLHLLGTVSLHSYSRVLGEKLLVPSICSSIYVFHGVSSVDFLEYIYAPLALILFCVSLIWLAKVSEVERQHPLVAQASVFDIYYAHLVNQSGVLGLLWLLHSDNPWCVLSQGSWHSLLFHGYLAAILLLGMVLNFFVGITVLCFSPVVAALLHSAYPLALFFLQFI